MRRTSAAAWLLAPWAALGGCGGPSGPSGDPVSVDPAAAAGEVGFGYRVTVLEPGSAPFRRLRYAVPDGHVDTFTVSSTATSETSAAGTTRSSAPDRIVAEVRVGPAETASDGRIRAAFAITRAEVPERDATTQERVAALVGRRGVLVRDELGRTRGFSLDPAGGGPDEVGASASSMLRAVVDSFPVLPYRDVGIGAVWLVETQLTDPLPVRQSARIRWVGVDPDGALVLETEVAQRGSSATLTTGSGPVSVSSVTGTGRARSVARTDRLVASLHADVAVTLDGEIADGEAAIPIQVVTRVVTDVARQPVSVPVSESSSSRSSSSSSSASALGAGQDTLGKRR